MFNKPWKNQYIKNIKNSSFTCIKASIKLLIIYIFFTYQKKSLFKFKKIKE